MLSKPVRRIITLCLLVASWLVSGSQPFAVGQDASPAAASGTRPNMIFFLSDDHHHLQLGCAGHPLLKTPTIDRLAQQGTRFRNAFVTTSICAASRATYLTGLYERGHKFTFGTLPISEQHAVASYPALLKSAGYRTGFVGKFGVQVAGKSRAAMFDTFKPLNRSPYLKPQADGSKRHVSEIAGDHAIEFLEQQNANTPFCLSVSFNAPHAEDSDKQMPYPWPKAVEGMYEDARIAPPELADPEIFLAQPEYLKRSLNRQRFFWRWDSPERYERNMKAYYRMLSGIDGVMGRVLDKVRDLGLADNTIVVFCGDNGYYMGNRGFAGKWSHYEESLRVPMVIMDPRVAPSSRGQVRDELALNVDIAATLLEMAGVPQPDHYQGMSLNAAVQGKPLVQPRTDFLCEHLMHHPAIPKWEGVRDQRYVYAHYFEQSADQEFLHDLQQDPQQLRNLSKDESYQATLARLRARCQELKTELGGEYSLEAFPRARQAQPRRKPNRLPNVVMIISDDQAWTDYSFMGHPVIQTPNLDRLAAQSATFPRGYVPTSLCRPSLATMITGLYAHQHGITGNDPALAPGLNGRQRRANSEYGKLCQELISKIDQQPTLPKWLATKGYVSHQSGKWWEGNFARGGFTHGMSHGDPARGGRHGDQGLEIGRKGLQAVTEFIDSAGDRPFFVWYAPFLPHTPHNPPERLLKKYQAEGRPEALAKYYAMCEWFDESCGELIGHLQERRLQQDTIVIYVTDNGWIQRTPQSQVPAGWKNGFAPRSKQSPYEGGIRTPIMIRWPGQIQPGVYDLGVSSIDLAPTILSAAGLPIPDNLPGTNLLPVIEGQAKYDKPLFGEIFAHDVADLNDPSASLVYRWCIEGRWKLILTYEGRLGRYGSVHPQTGGEIQLFDLMTDPHETTNLASKNPKVVARLSKAIQDWWAASTPLAKTASPE